MNYCMISIVIKLFHQFLTVHLSILTPIHIRHHNILQEAVDVGVLLGRGFQQLEAKLFLRVQLGGKMLRMVHWHRYERFH